MAATIRFLNGEALEKGIPVLRLHGEAVPTGQPDLYYVSDHMLRLLKQGQIRFEQVDPEHYGLMQVSEKMFTSLRKSVNESRKGKVIRVENPRCLDDIISADSRD